MIAVAIASVPGMIDQRSQDVQAKPSDRSVGHWPFEIGCGRGQRIEWRSVITELDRQLSALHGQRDPNSCRDRVFPMPVFDDVSKQLFEYEQQP
jgi:hypothetical protein